jgi:hypothetical protein
MIEANIERSLWYETADGRVTINQSCLLELAEPLVVLGEAGMGKSHLLEWLATNPGYKRCTARALINRHDPRTLLVDANVLVIDALDEVSAQKDGDAVDLVLRQLGVLGYPSFVLSCRVADWRSATGKEAIREQYDRKPIELHLLPFNDEDAVRFLSLHLGQADAETVVDRFNHRGLNGMLGNPQTLELILRAATTGMLPETKGELFESAIEVLRKEHREGTAHRAVPRDKGINASGAAFAGLILTGNEHLVRTAEIEAVDGDLQLIEISTLPGGDAVDSMLGTRLFRANGADQFSYWHRRIGEFLGALWLSRHADTPRKRRRLLNAFHSHGLVPASLRGIHAWLAREPSLSEAIITFDPMGVIEYGDADNLTAQEGRWLLCALVELAKNNPRFAGWGSYSMQGVMRQELINELLRIVQSPDETPALHVLVLRSMKGTPVAERLQSELYSLALDTKNYYSSRFAAADALVGVKSSVEWSSFLAELWQWRDESSVRLAIDLASSTGVEPYSDELIVDLVMTHSAIPARVSGVLWRLERELPIPRINGVLDRFAIAAADQGTDSYVRGSNDRTDFAYHLIARRLSDGAVDAKRLWSWIKPFDASMGYQRETRAKVESRILNSPELRRELQYQALLIDGVEQSLHGRCFRMTRTLPCLSPTPEDVIALLDQLDHADQLDDRWREMIQLIRHDGPIGREVRDAAKRFSKGDQSLIEWIDDLAIRQPAEWEVQDAKRQSERRAKLLEKHLRHREDYAKHVGEMRSGDWRALVSPAKAYLNLFTDIGHDKDPHERIADWLGDDIAHAAHAGFDAFLLLDPPEPNAKQLAESFAEGRSWHAEHIIAAGMAERFRTGRGFDDLTDERLIAGFFVLVRTKVDDHANVKGLESAIELAVRERGIFGKAMRMYMEPQFEAQLERVDGLTQFMRSDADAPTASELALEWLKRFPSMPEAPELELIGRLIRSGHRDSLRQIWEERLGLTDAGRARNWVAVGLIVAFDQTVARVEASNIDPKLIWHIRQFTGGRHGDEANYVFGPTQIRWIIASFRSAWPRTNPPTGGWSGKSNPWEASEYLGELVARLGRDASSEAASALQTLRDAPHDGYSEILLSVSSEQAQIRVEAAYAPLTLTGLNAILEDTTPVSAMDLQFFMMEELALIQSKVTKDDAESWRGFFDDAGVAYEEERCRDHLIGLLRQGSLGINLDPEAHLADDKEADIACAVGALRIPIEVKGQWHPELWDGADAQLDRLYASDWRAAGRGIYLVLWFGAKQPPNKRLSSPGRRIQRPSTPEDLRQMLIDRSPSARDGRVSIFVLDLER